MRFDAVALAAAIVATALPGCGDQVNVVALEPPYGPVAGGTMVTVRGDGFESRPGTVPQVLIGGREAPIVIPVDDEHLTVFIPPATGPGDVNVRVVLDDRSASAAGAFRYSTAPVLTEVSPHEVFVEGGTTRVRLRGHGLLAEGAGPPTLLIDGEAVDATVERDDELSFVAPQGWPLREPAIELINRRGDALFPRAFLYVAGHPGLLVFSANFERFAVHFDPVGLGTLDIPRFNQLGISSVVRDQDGGYWALDNGGRLAALDASDQVLGPPRETGHWLTAIERVDDGYVACDEGLRLFGRLNVDTGAFTPLSSLQPGFGPCGLAFDGTRLYLGGVEGEPPVAVLREVDRHTGQVRAPVTVTDGPSFGFDELRFFAGTLYAIGDGDLFTIDPATGAATREPLANLNAFALATYQ